MSAAGVGWGPLICGFSCHISISGKAYFAHPHFGD